MRFHWFDDGACSTRSDDDVATAVNVLLDAVSGPGRVWNPYARQMVRSEFKQRILKAQRGQLEPVDEVKPVDIRNPPPLYEIRWQNIPVTHRAESGAVNHEEVVVRMYHSEPVAMPDVFIGHHAHEKITDVADVNGAQQEHIALAVQRHLDGESSDWGIAHSLETDIESDLWKSTPPRSN